MLAEGAMLLRRFAVMEAAVAMTNCGRVGWTTSRRGYPYDTPDPETGEARPSMPLAFRQLVERAAARAGFPGLDPDSCLINRYEPGRETHLAP